jgi:hypothetical protein
MGATVVGMTWLKVGQQLDEPGTTMEQVQPMVGKAMLYTWIDLAIRAAVILVMVWRPT